jgi:hypothetical protein
MSFAPPRPVGIVPSKKGSKRLMKTIVIPLFTDTTLQALRDRFGDVLARKFVLIIACLIS